VAQGACRSGDGRDRSKVGLDRRGGLEDGGWKALKSGFGRGGNDREGDAGLGLWELTLKDQQSQRCEQT
jgi:hypothetical protein